MNAWQRFWSRGEYSQSAILKEMSKLYKAAKAKQEKEHSILITDSFINNYKILLDRAIAQNKKYKEVNFITRFFEAKREIKFKKNDILREYLAPTKEEKNPWWGNCNPNKYNSLARNNPAIFKVQQEQFTSILNIKLKKIWTAPVVFSGLSFKVTGLETVQNHIDKKIYGAEQFYTYLQENKDIIIQNLKNMNAIESD